MDFNRFVQTALKRKWIILFFAVVAATTTFFFIKTGGMKFESVTKIATGFTNTHEDKNENNPSVISGKFSNLEEVFTSPTVLQNLSFKIFIHDLKNRQQAFVSFERIKQTYSEQEIQKAGVIFQAKLNTGAILTSANAKEKRLLEMLTTLGYYGEDFNEKLKIKRVSSTDFLEIKATTDNKYLSAFVVNTIAKEGIKLYNANMYKTLIDNAHFYEDLMKKKKAALNQHLDTLNRFKSSNQVIDYSTESQNKLQRLAALQTSKEEEKQKLSALSQSIASINKTLRNNESGLDKNALSEKITQLKKGINRLNAQYIQDNANQVILDSINSLREELKEQTYLYQQTTSPENTLYEDLKKQKITDQIAWEIAQSNLQTIERSIDSVQQELGGFANKETELSSFQTNIDILKMEYLDLLTKYNKAMNSAKDFSHIHIIEPGQPAIEPEASKATLFAGIAGFATIAFALGFLFLLEFLDNRLLTEKRFNEISDLPTIGTLNSIKGKTVNIEALFSNDVQLDPQKELFLSQLRQLRYQFENQKEKIFLITSNLAGEGKTLSIIALAYSFALIKKKVLIIDTNFKNNKLTQLFASKTTLKNCIRAEAKIIREEPVLAGIEENAAEILPELADTNFSVEKWTEAITHSGLSGIDVIGCEISNYSPSELFAGKPFDAFLEESKKHYDYIIMEGGASGIYSDSKELSIYAEKIVAVISAANAIPDSKAAALSFFESLGEKFMGVIINKVS